MGAVTLELGQRWTLGDRLGSGGFGAVFAATGADGTRAAAKLVPQSPGSERELLFVDLGGVRNVVPVIDSGEHDGQWVLVMPRADGTLADRLHDAGGPLALAETLTVLRDVAAALADLDGRVVHRDLKPANVLHLDGSWCLADFGIARYAEASTATATRKHAMSAPYAAPERWRDEHATSAADVYAVGVMAHELLTGRPPFTGPTREDYRQQHLASDPPSLPGVDLRLSTLISECLFKQPGARPTPVQLAARLEIVGNAGASAGATSLAAAYGRHAEQSAAEHRAASEAQTEQERRAGLFVDAQRAVGIISDALLTVITTEAPGAAVARRPEGWSAQLAAARIGVSAAKPCDGRSWGGWDAPVFDVVGFATVSIVIPADRNGYEGRSHSLYFADCKDMGRYAWHETAFMVSPLIPERGRQNPFALDPGELAAKAFWRGMAERQVAWPVTELILGDLEEFVDRWVGWFAAAVDGRLMQPNQMPERQSEGTWRR